MAEFAAANTASMVLFVGNPTNVVICEGFRVNNAAFTAYTILPFLACSIVRFIALAAQFQKSKFIPKSLDVAGDLDVRSVLLDPTGAWVGSLLLGTCLVVIIIVSFFHVDVWKISLPFALAKFAYDLAWDNYRYVHKIPMLGQTGAKKSDEDLTSAQDDLVLRQLRQHRTIPAIGNAREDKSPDVRSNVRQATSDTYASDPNSKYTQPMSTASLLPPKLHFALRHKKHQFSIRFPTLYTAFPRLPFALVPFAFSQFILIEALAHQGWIEIFGRWLVLASGRKMFPTIWLIGVLGVVLCNLSGTNIGATILLTKVVRAASLSAPPDVDINLEAFNRSAAIALAVASNIGAVSFTFSASLAGLLWRQILNQKGIFIRQRTFAMWNMLPLAVMTVAGLGVVCAQMAVLY